MNDRTTRTIASLIAAATLAGGISMPAHAVETTPAPDANQNQTSITPVERLDRATKDATGKLTRTDWTDASRANVKTMLDQANTVLTFANATDEQRTQAAISLETATADLITVARQRLKALIAKAGKATTDQTIQYTKETLDALHTALDDANRADSDQNMDETTVTRIADALDKAITGLTTTGTQALRDALDQAETIRGNNLSYTSETRTPFDQAYRNAKILPQNATDTQKTNAANALTDAISRLVTVGRQRLLDAISHAEQTDTSLTYTDESKTRFDQALQTARELTADRNETMQTDTATTLENAIRALTLASRQRLDQLIRQADTIRANGVEYTGMTRVEFDKAYETAKQAVPSGDMSVDDRTYTTIADRLDNAIGKLVSVARQQLLDAIAVAQTNADKGPAFGTFGDRAYTDDTLANLNRTLDEAKAIADDPTASDKACADATRRVNEANDALEPYAWRVGDTILDENGHANITMDRSTDSITIEGSDGSTLTLTDHADETSMPTFGVTRIMRTFTTNTHGRPLTVTVTWDQGKTISVENTDFTLVDGVWNANVTRDEHSLNDDGMPKDPTVTLSDGTTGDITFDPPSTVNAGTTTFVQRSGHATVHASNGMDATVNITVRRAWSPTVRLTLERTASHADGTSTRPARSPIPGSTRRMRATCPTRSPCPSCSMTRSATCTGSATRVAPT